MIIKSTLLLTQSPDYTKWTAVGADGSLKELPSRMHEKPEECVRYVCSMFEVKVPFAGVFTVLTNKITINNVDEHGKTKAIKYTLEF